MTCPTQDFSANSIVVEALAVSKVENRLAKNWMRVAFEGTAKGQHLRQLNVSRYPYRGPAVNAPRIRGRLHRS